MSKYLIIGVESIPSFSVAVWVLILHIAYWMASSERINNALGILIKKIKIDLIDLTGSTLDIENSYPSNRSNKIHASILAWLMTHTFDNSQEYHAISK